MTATVISICNSALTLIGADRIASLSEESEEATICQERFDHVRDSVLQIFPWNCCIVRKKLTQNKIKPAFEYQYSHNLPISPQCLSVLSVQETDEWVIEGDFLVSNTSPVNIVYVGKITEPHKYPPYLCELIAARLSIEIAYKLTGNVNVHNSCMQLYTYKLKEAVELEGRQGNMPRTIDDLYRDPWFFRS